MNEVNQTATPAQDVGCASGCSAPSAFSGLYDRTGRPIFIGDRLRFFPSEATTATDDGCVWDGTVCFEDGVYTISILNVEQVSNPRDWTQPHDWVKSRSWGCMVGYGEFGSWNCPRQPLTHIHNGFGSTQEHFERLFKPLAEKIGWGKRFLNVEVIQPNVSGEARWGKRR